MYITELFLQHNIVGVVMGVVPERGVISNTAHFAESKNDATLRIFSALIY